MNLREVEIMAHQICIIAAFPGGSTPRFPLLQSGDQLDGLAPVGEWLIDHGATEVKWQCVENVHGAVLSRPGTDCRIEDGAGEGTSPMSRSRNRGPEGGEKNAVDCLTKARRALQKKELIAYMNGEGTGRNAARLAIASLVKSGKAREFSVPRPGRKSAIFVALLG